MEEMKNVIKNIIFQEFGIIANGQENFEDIGLDSLKVVQLIVILEEKYSIIYPEECMNSEDLKSFSALASCIENVIKLNKRRV